MASSCLILQRGISTSCVNYGKRNFRKFLFLNKRGSRDFKKKQSTDPYPDYPIDKRGVRDTGFKIGNRWINVPEMVPELIVPSLEGFTLKPYVSYKVENISQGEYTAKDLFNEIYAKKIEEDFNKQELDPNGDPMNPNEYEKLTPQEAADRAKRTGTDIFCEDVRYKSSTIID
ncbi:39S ribosomal protein L41, mitochondrial [Vespa velutina]|uniref:39S ribosomal protein L41, mitochondrial n=1 Tax=Vespa velutina TaxID=202808 RepID=UPI001FB25B60|nr:39S ribosomal protein L41, mitochondrial [Vespa velutina]XP_047363049.1 39S ribosomal protein L41, mitochondrial [Vespa velutina]